MKKLRPIIISIIFTMAFSITFCSVSIPATALSKELGDYSIYMTDYMDATRTNYYDFNVDGTVDISDAQLFLLDYMWTLKITEPSPAWYDTRYYLPFITMREQTGGIRGYLETGRSLREPGNSIIVAQVILNYYTAVISNNDYGMYIDRYHWKADGTCEVDRSKRKSKSFDEYFEWYTPYDNNKPDAFYKSVLNGG